MCGGGKFKLEAITGRGFLCNSEMRNKVLWITTHLTKLIFYRNIQLLDRRRGEKNTSYCCGLCYYSLTSGRCVKAFFSKFSHFIFSEILDYHIVFAHLCHGITRCWWCLSLCALLKLGCYAKNKSSQQPSGTI